MPDEPSAEQKLFQSFAEEAHRRCATISSTLAMIEMGQGPASGLAELKIEAHTLKGTAAVLGLTEVSEQAARLEQILVEAGSAEALGPAVAAAIQEATAAIEDGARAAADSDDQELGA
jgi:chemotaxis protein histidine kinase CheA